MSLKPVLFALCGISFVGGWVFKAVVPMSSAYAEQSTIGQKIVKCERIELDDSSGNKRIGLGITEDGTTAGISIYDKSGSHRVSIAETDGDPKIVLMGPNGKPRAVFALEANQVGMYLLDTDGKPHAALTSTNAAGNFYVDAGQTTPPLNPTIVSGWSKLKIGMSTDEVESLLGQPKFVGGKQLVI